MSSSKIIYDKIINFYRVEIHRNIRGAKFPLMLEACEETTEFYKNIYEKLSTIYENLGLAKVTPNNSGKASFEKDMLTSEDMDKSFCKLSCQITSASTMSMFDKSNKNVRFCRHYLMEDNSFLIDTILGAEDHIVISIMSMQREGLNEIVCDMLGELDDKFDFAISDVGDYLTSNPEDSGSGIRMYCVLDTMMLDRHNKLQAICEGLSKLYINHDDYFRYLYSSAEWYETKECYALLLSSVVYTDSFGEAFDEFADIVEEVVVAEQSLRINYIYGNTSEFFEDWIKVLRTSWTQFKVTESEYRRVINYVKMGFLAGLVKCEHFEIPLIESLVMEVFYNEFWNKDLYLLELLSANKLIEFLGNLSYNSEWEGWKGIHPELAKRLLQLNDSLCKFEETGLNMNSFCAAMMDNELKSMTPVKKKRKVASSKKSNKKVRE